MKLDNLELYNYLSEQGIKHLYHANTVTTACTFLLNGGLLSRGAVESRGLKQTSQSSDPIDVNFNVWNDIFLDSVDLHGLFPRQNYYGPVLFKYSLEILKYPNLPDVFITKDNPIRWDISMDDEEKYFQSIDELENNYKKGSYEEMITLRNTFEILPFENYLEEVILDNPAVLVNDTSMFKKARKAIDSAVANSQYDYSDVQFTIRKCDSSCYCQDNYLHQVPVPELKKLFTVK